MTLELVPWRGSRVPVLTGEVVRYTTQDYINWLTSNQRWYSGAQPMTTTYGSRPAEPISYSFEGFVQGMLYTDGPVAAAEAYRLRVFGQAPLLYQELAEGRPGDFFDDPVLDQLRAPWAGATLSDLMKRALIYGDFAGNAFVLDLDDELVLVRPDWIEIVLAKREHRGGQVGWRQVGIVYYEGGLRSGDGVAFLPGEYAHFVPGLPDPLATYRGQSWLTPLIREVQADIAAHDHKLAFFENAASPNLSVSLPKEITPAQFNEFVDLMDAKHKGALNAGKTLYTGGGADVTPIGSNMVEMDFAKIIGKSETRVANASGVPAVLLSFSEGMQGSSLNAGNYTAAKRNFVDTTMRDLWQNWAGSIQQMDRFRSPREKSRLWYDGRDIPFLHEDAKDTADITHTQVLAIEAGMRAGFKPDPMVQAVRHNNLDLLVGEHTGLFSVQMQAPGSTDSNGDGRPDSGADAAPAEPIDFGALRADFDDFDDDEIERAVWDAYGDEDEDEEDDEELDRSRYDVRVPKGFEGGGRFRKLSDRLVALLRDWAKGEGDDDPLDEYSRDQLRRVAKELADRARADGNEERAARLTPRRGASSDEIKLALYKDVRAHVRGERERKAEPGRAKFTLQGDAHKGQDVAVHRLPGDKPALYRENDAGKQGALVAKFDSLDEMAAWADEHGEPRLAEWARGEAGGKGAPAPGKRAAPRANAAPTVDKADTDTKFRAAAKKLSPPFGDDAKRQWDEARLHALGYKDKTPEDAVRQLEADIAANQERLREHEAQGIEPHLQSRRMRALSDDIDRQREMVKLIRKTYGLQSPAKRTPRKATPRSDLPDASDPEALRDALDLRTVPELKDMLRERGLAVSGRKRDLVDRLVDAPGGKPAAEPAAPSKATLKADAKDRLLAAIDGIIADSSTDPRWNQRAMGVDSPAEVVGRIRQQVADGSIAPEEGEKRISSLAVRFGVRDNDVIGISIGQRLAEMRKIGNVAEATPNPDTPALSLYTPAEAAKLNPGLDMTVPESRDVINGEARRRVETVLDDVDEMLTGDASDRALLSRLDGRRKLGAPGSVVDELEAAVRAGDRDRLRQVSADIRGRLGAPAATKAPGRAPKPIVDEGTFDPSTLDGLTIRQKRARLRAMGFSQAYIDDVAPTAAMAKKAATKAPSGPRPSGLPTDRKPESGDFDDLAERLTAGRQTEAQILETIQDLNATDLVRLARKFPGTAGHGRTGMVGQVRDAGLRLPEGLTTDEKRRWLAKYLAGARTHDSAWRSEDFDEDDLFRAGGSP